MWARFSAPVQTDPAAHPASCTMGTSSFPGVKRPGRGADHPPPSNRRGNECVGLYLYSPSGPSWPVIGSTFTFTFPVIVRDLWFSQRYWWMFKSSWMLRVVGLVATDVSEDRSASYSEEVRED